MNPIRLVLICFWAFAWGMGGSSFFVAWAENLTISLDYPPSGSNWDRPCSTAVVAGTVHVHGEKITSYDVVIAFDTSGSTSRPSGADVNGNGVKGEIVESLKASVVRESFHLTDPGDSILAAEVEGAKRLLRFLDPSTTRVALVSFSGDISGTLLGHTDLTVPDAVLEHPLTPDYGQIREALDRLQARGARGGTNVAAGIRLGVEELLGLNENGSRLRPDVQRLILLLTDGIPTFPVGNTASDSEDKILTISAAHVAFEGGIRIYTYGMGMDVLSEPFAMEEVARISGGKYIPLSHPADILDQLEEAKFVDLRSLEVSNVTLDRSALDKMLYPEGYFIATVPITKGINEIVVKAVASDRTQAQASLYLNCLGEDGGKELVLDLAGDTLSDLKLVLGRDRERLLQLVPLRPERELVLEPGPKGNKENLELELEPLPGK